MKMVIVAIDYSFKIANLSAMSDDNQIQFRS